MASIPSLDIHDFLLHSRDLPVLDVRSEKEYAYGHIPGSISFPILNNDEREQVGTCYKQQGHEKAVILGYKLAGPRFHEFISEACRLFPDRTVMIHCYRGGMRSGIMAGILKDAGFRVELLTGGYKTYRHHVLSVLTTDLKLRVVGGFTGTGKTDILKSLERSGRQVIDIEALASHRGSAFGAIGLPPQPSQEQFENDMATAIAALDARKPIWVEDESRMTGRLKIPDTVFAQMQDAPLFFVERSFEQRSDNILSTYGTFDRQLLISATENLVKRLGNLRMREAVRLLEAGDLQGWLGIVLPYYDKTYLHGLQQKPSEKVIRVEEDDAVAALIRLAEGLPAK